MVPVSLHQEQFTVLWIVQGLAKDNLLVLSIYREEMYDPGRGVEGATELLIGKNRNGQTGFVDLYFRQRWMRFEDMLDPE